MEYTIRHSGVKGMKWGVRKDSYYTPKDRGKYRLIRNSVPGISNKKKRKKKPTESSFKKTLKYGVLAASAVLVAKNLFKIKDIHNKPTVEAGKNTVNSILNSLSNNDLKNKITRMQLEEQYKNLINPSGGQKNLLDEASKVTNSLYNFSTSAINLYNNYEKIKKIIESRESNQ